MRIRRAAALLGCLAALPLFGCAGNYATAQWQPVPAAPAPAYSYPPGEVAAPAAILVVLPGAGIVGADPALWAAQGFDVVSPPPAAIAQLAADEDVALARLVASARRLAAAPLWLVGPSPLIETALAAPGIGPGEVSGVVVTGTGSNLASCTESLTYFDAGNGAPPKISTSKYGNACPPGPAFGAAGAPAPASPAPAVRPNAPKVIEASNARAASPAAQRSFVRHLAERIKAAAG